jgi:hypothetical protein
MSVASFSWPRLAGLLWATRSGRPNDIPIINVPSRPGRSAGHGYADFSYLGHHGMES